VGPAADPWERLLHENKARCANIYGAAMVRQPVGHGHRIFTAAGLLASAGVWLGGTGSAWWEPLRVCSAAWPWWRKLFFVRLQHAGGWLRQYIG